MYTVIQTNFTMLLRTTSARRELLNTSLPGASLGVTGAKRLVSTQPNKKEQKNKIKAAGSWLHTAHGVLHITHRIPSYDPNHMAWEGGGCPARPCRKLRVVAGEILDRERRLRRGDGCGGKVLPL